ncbi:ornithine carbamoyltransferase [Candidatus Aerophobetes bacterium]|nr:ornithine carbamoyltransferase [Candidatus Aerophobetes bacterium]
MKRDFIDIQEFTADELKTLIYLIEIVKKASKERALPDLLYKASLAMIFEEPSTRTRTSFEVAMTELGGHAIYMKPGEIHLGARETIGDTAQVLSRMCDGIEARLLKHKNILELVKYATVPVISGLTDYQHPTQSLCDIFTMYENARKIKGLNLTFIGDSTENFNSLLFISSKLGLNFYMASPKKYQPKESILNEALKNAKESGSEIVITEDPKEAVLQADFVYTDLWYWIGQEDEEEERRAAFMPKYQVNEKLMKLAPLHAKFMHCLPASRNTEVTDNVIDSEQSIVFDEAENRLYTEEALLIAFIGRTLKPWEKDKENIYYKEINKIMGKLS